MWAWLYLFYFFWIHRGHSSCAPQEGDCRGKPEREEGGDTGSLLLFYTPCKRRVLALSKARKPQTMFFEDRMWEHLQGKEMCYTTFTLLWWPVVQFSFDLQLLLTEVMSADSVQWSRAFPSGNTHPCHRNHTLTNSVRLHWTVRERKQTLQAKGSLQVWVWIAS